MVVRKIRKFRSRVKQEVREIEKNAKKKRITELETEIIAAMVLTAISGFYIFVKFGEEQLIDTIFLWMFPASITIIITLFVILLVEVLHKHET